MLDLLSKAACCASRLPGLVIRLQLTLLCALCSMTGGIRETQEMLDFCGKHNIVCKSEVIDADYVNTAYERLMKNDVYYRFVIDVLGSLLVN